MDTPPPPSPPPPRTIGTSVMAHGSEIDPPTRVPSNRMEQQVNQPLPNGVLMVHQLPVPLVVGYGKCRRNHAIGTGGVTLDGCGEFIPSPIFTPADLNTQECLACGCHRSFHRCDADNFPQPVQHIIEYQPHPHQPSNSPSSRLATMENSSDSPDSSSPPPISSSNYPPQPYMFLNLNSAIPPPPPPPPEATNNHYTSTLATAAAASGSNRNGNKRFRSKFSQVQKEKMQELAERIGWKLQRTKEEMIVGFCNEIGVTKDVFKVWMHNHRSTSSNNKGNNNHEDGGNATTNNGSSSSF